MIRDVFSTATRKELGIPAARLLFGVFATLRESKRLQAGAEPLRARVTPPIWRCADCRRFRYFYADLERSLETVLGSLGNPARSDIQKYAFLAICRLR